MMSLTENLKLPMKCMDIKLKARKDHREEAKYIPVVESVSTLPIDIIPPYRGIALLITMI